MATPIRTVIAHGSLTSGYHLPCLVPHQGGQSPVEDVASRSEEKDEEVQTIGYEKESRQASQRLPWMRAELREGKQMQEASPPSSHYPSRDDKRL